jgi:SMI1 / KNR4 family (SUKH-1)
MVEAVSKVVDQWAAEGINLNHPATLGDIQRAEEILGFIFPSDFKEIYLLADGFKDGDWRTNMFSLWPLQRIIDEYLEELNRNNEISQYRNLHARNFIGFCDYLVNSHQIGFFKNTSGVFKSYNEFSPIALSFQEALQLINNDSDLIY